MIRKCLFTLLIGTIFISSSCSSDQDVDEIKEASSIKEFSRTTSSNNGNIVAIIYPYEICYSNETGYNYAIYATASELENFERQVSVVVIDGDNSIVESLIMKIPANKPSSTSVRVFKNTIKGVNQATIKPTKVFSNGVNITSQYQLITINEFVSNCLSIDNFSGFSPCDLDYDFDSVSNCIDADPTDPNVQ